MNAPLPVDLTTSFANAGPNVAGGRAYPVTLRAVPARSVNQRQPAFVERRRPDADTTNSALRSPVVLGFVGVMWGLLLSAILTLVVSAGLALAGVSWMAAGPYCAALILLVFGLVGLALHRGARVGHPSVTGMERYLEAAVERRRQYLYLSSVNALENARRLGVWERRFDKPTAPYERGAAVSVHPTRRHDPLDSTGFGPGSRLDFARYSGTGPGYAAAASG